MISARISSPEPGVQVAQGLVQQQNPGTDDQGAGQGDALLLSAAQLADPTFPVSRQPHLGQGLFDASLDLVFGAFPDLQSEGDVFHDSHMGEKGVILEHHARVPPVGGKVRNIVAVEEDPPLRRMVKAGDHPKDGRFSASAGAQQGEKLPFADRQV